MMRLDKFLAHQGLGTRKEVKKLIRSGRVLVNDQCCRTEDTKIKEESDQIKVDDVLLEYSRFTYLMLNKPQGVISATEDGCHTTVLDLIEEKVRDLFPVGRLDIDTEGLLLLTNDGLLAHELLAPKKHVEKCYEVSLARPLSETHINRIERGILLDKNERCQPARVQVLNDQKILLWISEGKYHQVKRMMLACDNEVTFLKRLTMGPLTLDHSLKPGEYRPCHLQEIEALNQIKNIKKNLD